MVEILEKVPECIPQNLRPGDFVELETPVADPDDGSNPFVIVLACPECGTPGLVSKKQLAGAIRIICGSLKCSAYFSIGEFGEIIPHKPY